MGVSYYITGSDGSGKTSFLKEVERKLIQQQIKYKHIWIRSPKITSKPLMLFCRITDLTKYKIVDGVKYGKHEFYHSKFVSWLYPLLQYIDFRIKWNLEKRKLNGSEILLFDRHAIDTLIDIMIDTGKMDLHQKRLGRAFIRLIPKNSSIIVMDVDDTFIRVRKRDTLHDEHLSQKVTAYRSVSESLGLKVIDNNRPYEKVKKDVFNYLGV